MGEKFVRKDYSKQITAYLLFLTSMYSLLYTCGFPVFTNLKEEDRTKYGLFF